KADNDDNAAHNQNRGEKRCAALHEAVSEASNQSDRVFPNRQISCFCPPITFSELSWLFSRTMARYDGWQ
ncbi:MAG: hypothetical protein AAF625_17525, partial [Pseudomonadota bacterium]